MAIKEFNYEAFAKDMTEQAVGLVPADLKDFEKQYILKTLNSFTLLAGKALTEDKNLDITDEDAVFITQIIAEWSYHKSIDLIHSGILPQHWDSIMQNIAFTIFEVAKRAILGKVPQHATIQAIEQQVIKTYNAAIEQLAEKKVIDEEIKNRALNQSNIDAMAKQAQEQAMQEAKAKELAQAQAQEQEQSQNNQLTNEQKQVAQKQNREINKNNISITNKQMKLMTLAIVLKILSQDKVTTILNKFDSQESQEIKQYMNIANLESQIDSDLISECIKDMRSYLPIKRKLTKENVLADLLVIYKNNSREKIEKIIRNERPLVKRFISNTYEGEFSHLSLKVAGIVTDYIKNNL